MTRRFFNSLFLFSLFAKKDNDKIINFSDSIKFSENYKIEILVTIEYSNDRKRTFKAKDKTHYDYDKQEKRKNRITLSKNEKVLTIIYNGNKIVYSGLKEIFK
jgi:hypothetical protein